MPRLQRVAPGDNRVLREWVFRISFAPGEKFRSSVGCFFFERKDLCCGDPGCFAAHLQDKQPESLYSRTEILQLIETYGMMTWKSVRHFLPIACDIQSRSREWIFDSIITSCAFSPDTTTQEHQVVVL